MHTKEVREASMEFACIPYQRLLTETERMLMDEKEIAYVEQQAVFKAEQLKHNQQKKEDNLEIE